MNAILTDGTHTKASRDEALFAVLSLMKEKLSEEHPDIKLHQLSEAFWDKCRDCVRDNVLDREMRCVWFEMCSQNHSVGCCEERREKCGI